jgi:hypothetical protein
MPCEVCKREKPVVARRLCNACYQRWRKTGSTEYQRRGRRNVCGVGGCEKPAVAKGLCDTHRKRMERHGHVSETRPDSWGAKEKHPLYHSWQHARRMRGVARMCETWERDFLQFIADVGERPSRKHKLFAANDAQPLGPENFVWKRAITERVEGEDERTYQNRAQKVYRAVRSEAFQGYELKRNFGLSNADYRRMHDAQGGRCAICQQPETARHQTTGESRALAIDHCHRGGQVRALLCSRCNTGIGSFDDDVARLKAAIAYLERHKTPSDEG